MKKQFKMLVLDMRKTRVFFGNPEKVSDAVFEAACNIINGVFTEEEYAEAVQSGFIDLDHCHVRRVPVRSEDKK